MCSTCPHHSIRSPHTTPKAVVNMRTLTLLLAIAAIVVNRSAAQDNYQDYAGGYDNLYQDYAAKNAVGGGGFGFGHLALASTASYILGAKIHSRRITKKLKKKHQVDQKKLYTQYYNDVYKLEEQKLEQSMVIDELKKAIKQANEDYEMENLQREYDEFKQPDVDGDDRISRTEFNMYVKNYLVNYPGLTEKDYPTFEAFDHDKDGYVSFTEYAQQMAVQAQQAELDKYYAQSKGGSGKKEAQKANALYDLYGSAAESDGFQDLYAQIRR